MKELLQTMIDIVIFKLGFEAKETIEFCKLCEDLKQNNTEENRHKVICYYNLIIRLL